MVDEPPAGALALRLDAVAITTVLVCSASRIWHTRPLQARRSSSISSSEVQKSMSAAAMPCSFSTSSVRMSFTANWRVSTVTSIGKLPN